MKKIILSIFIVNYSLGDCQFHNDYFDKRYNEQAILMTHNSTSLKYPTSNFLMIALMNLINKLPSWLINEDKKNSARTSLHAIFSMTSDNLVADQTLPVHQQLKDGVRGFKIPIHLFSNGEIYICHAFTKNRLKSEIHSRLNLIPRWVKNIPVISAAINDIMNTFNENPCLLDRTYQRFATFLSEINAFLEANPDEIVTFYLDDFALEKNNPEIQNKIRTVLAESGIDNKIYFDARINMGQKWPLISEMIKNKKQVVIFSGHSNWENLGVFDYSKIVFRTNYYYQSVSKLENDSNNPLISYGTVADNKLFVIDNYTTPIITGSEFDASIVNNYDKIKQRFCQYQNKAGGIKPNILMVDFYHLPINDPMRFINDWNKGKINCLK